MFPAFFLRVCVTVVLWIAFYNPVPVHTRSTSMSALIPLATSGTSVDTLLSIPHLVFNPLVITANADSTRFVVATIETLNLGGGTLVLNKVVPSCGCAFASVQRRQSDSLGVASIRLGVNTETLLDSINNVDFEVHSNAGNSPTVFRLVVRR